MRRLIAVFGLYLLIAIGVTFPLVTQISDRLAGFDYGDAYQTARHMWWFGEALRTGQPLFFQPLLGYPDGFMGVNLWATPLDFFPGWLLALVLPLPAAYNITVLLLLALNGAAMHQLMGQALGALEDSGSSGGRAGAALLSGLIYMLYPTMQGHLGAGHVGLLAQFAVPLYVGALLRLSRGESRPLATMALAALWLFVSALGQTLQIVYVTLPILAVALLPALWRRDWRAFWRMTGASAVGLAALALFLLPVVEEAAGYRDAGVVRYSADLLAAVSPSFLHPLWGQVLSYPRQVLGVNLDEGAAYIGVIAGALALVGVWRQRGARLWLLLALVAYGLALGPLLKLLDQPVQFRTDIYLSYVTLPWAWLADLPGFALLRTPARASFGLALAVALMAGFGVYTLLRWSRAARVGRAALVAVVGGLVAFDYQVFFPLPTAPAAIPAAVSDLALRSDVRAVFGVPWIDTVAAKVDLYLQTAHHRPLIAGQVARRTPVDPDLLALLEATLDPALLDLVGADVVIVHRQRDDGTLFERARATLGEPFYADESLALFETPPPDAPPSYTATRYGSGYLMYAPSLLWTLIAGTAGGDRSGEVRLNGQPIHPVGAGAFAVPLRLEAGFHRVEVEGVPPCDIVNPSPALFCRPFAAADLVLAPASNAESGAAQFGRGVTLGVTLGGWRLEQDGRRVSLWLDWAFAEAVDAFDIRFVHVLGADGRPAAQSDVPLGNIAPGARYAEAVTLTLPDDLPPGTYPVVVGWYRFPEVERFALLSAPAGAEARLTDRLLTVGAVSVEG